MIAGRNLTRMMSVGRAAVLLGLAGGCLPGAVLHAQALRDPTVPPAGAVVADTVAIVDPGAPAAGAMSVIVRDGRPHLVVGSRLVAQGQTFGQTKIERISETEVWLREGATLRKVPMFTGVQRSRAAWPSSACAAVKPGRTASARTSEARPSAPRTITCDPAQP
jgi:hypothetical protein